MCCERNLFPLQIVAVVLDLFGTPVGGSLPSELGQLSTLGLYQNLDVARN